MVNRYQLAPAAQTRHSSHVTRHRAEGAPPHSFNSPPIRCSYASDVVVL